jgi:hypothetical protein
LPLNVFEFKVMARTNEFDEIEIRLL